MRESGWACGDGPDLEVVGVGGREGSSGGRMRTTSSVGSAPFGRITIEEILRLPVVERARPVVAAGAANLGRRVRWTHVLDIPDIADLLRGGEFVLTTGAGAGDDTRAQIAFIQSLARDGAVGLAVELGTVYRRALPIRMVEAAEAVGLPLIAFRRRVRFVELTEAIHHEVMTRQFAVLQRRVELSERFAPLILGGAAIPRVLEELAATIENPVVFESPAHRLVYHVIHRVDDDVALRAWENLQRARARGDDEADHAIVVDVERDGVLQGRLVALDVDSAFQELDKLALEQAAVAVALDLQRSSSEESLRVHARGAFLTDLLQSKPGEAAARRRAAALGFRADGRILPIAASVRREAGDMSPSEFVPALASTATELHRVLVSEQPGLLAEARDRSLLVLAALNHRQSLEDARTRVVETMHQVAAHCFGEERGLAVAVGSPETRWEAVGRALNRAEATARAAALSSWRPWRDARRLELIDLLLSLRDNPQLSSFVDAQLGPLLEHESARGSELLATLECYLRCGGRKADAARALHVQRQSLYYRLSRIEELLDVDLQGEDVRLALHLALRARAALMS
jgi:PucR family transcriptional regulator, purine catabolism regulatory protein